MKRAWMLVGSLSIAMVLAGCSSGDDDDNGGSADASPDAHADAGHGDATVDSGDAGVDASDAANDASGDDASDGAVSDAGDAGIDANDAASGDASIADASDAASLDASDGAVADASDGAVADAGDAAAADASDASVDAADAADTAPTFNAGTALSFVAANGDYVQVDRVIQDDFTIEAWIMTAAAGFGTQFYQGRGVIYADVGGSANDFGTAIDSDGKWAFGTGNPDTTVASTSVVTTGQWVHVAAVRVASSGTIRVFVGGVMENEITGLNTASLNAQSSLYIGGNTIDGRYFDGTIDEVRVWSIARSQSDIQSTMSTRLVGSEAGLVGYWRFDEGSGTRAVDTSSSADDGTISGATYVTSTAPIQ